MPSSASALEELTPARAFRLFSLALATGLLLLGSSLAAPPIAWLAWLPPFVYGSCLAWAQRRHRVALNGTVKDSPYFLGFILTMVAMAKLFFDVGHIAGGSAGLSAILGEASAAIAATVIGLFFRQLLLSLDRAENFQDAVFQSALKQLNQGAVQLHKAQLEFQGLATEFSRARVSLLQSEEDAHTKYLSQLRAGTAVLSTIEEQYPTRVKALLDALREAAEASKKAAEDAAVGLGGMHQVLAAGVQGEIEAMRREIGKGTENLAAVRAKAAVEVQAVVTSLEGAVNLLQSHVESTADSVRIYPDRLAEVTVQLGEIGESVASLRESLDFLSKQGSETAGGFSRLEAAMTSLENSALSAAAARSQSLAREVDDIDRLLDDFVRLMQKRIKASPGEGFA